MKICTSCGREKDESEFAKSSRNKDGLRYSCCLCNSLASKEWRKNNSERHAQNNKKWASNNKSNCCARVKKYRDKHPEVNVAHNAVKVAIRSGRMVRQQCKVFDCFDIGEAHHEDYDKPLDVEWLCTKHHKQLHMEKKMSEVTADAGTVVNRYVTVRTVGEEKSWEVFYVNIIGFNGEVDTFGDHGYSHKRSARRAAIALAKKLDVSYRQDLEYTNIPQAFMASVTA